MAFTSLTNHSLHPAGSIKSLAIFTRLFAKSSCNTCDNEVKKSTSSQPTTANRIIGVSELLPDLRASLFEQFTGLQIFDSESPSCKSYPFLSIAKYSVPVVRERAQVVSKLVSELNYPPEKITLRLVNRFIFWQKLLGHPPLTGKAADIITKVSDTAKVKAKVRSLSKIHNQLKRHIPGNEIDEELLRQKEQLENEIRELKESLLDHYHLSEMEKSFAGERDSVNK